MFETLNRNVFFTVRMQILHIFNFFPDLFYKSYQRLLDF